MKDGSPENGSNLDQIKIHLITRIKVINKQHFHTGRIDLDSFRLKELHEKAVMEIVI